MRINLRCWATLDLPDDQQKEAPNDVIRTQSRIEAPERVGAVGPGRTVGSRRSRAGRYRLRSTALPTITAARIYPRSRCIAGAAATCIIVGLPAGYLAVDNAIANAVAHGGATLVQLSAVSSRAAGEIAIDDNGRSA